MPSARRASAALGAWKRRTALSFLQVSGAVTVVLTIMCLQLRTITPLVVAAVCLSMLAVGTLAWSVAVGRRLPTR